MTATPPTARSAESWLREAARRHQGRALVLGKGPSSQLFDPAAYPDHFIVGLNETGLHTTVDAAFVIDEDILLRDGQALIRRARAGIVVPHTPHIAHTKVGGLTWYGPNLNSAPDAAWRRVQPEKVVCFNLATAAAPQPKLGATYTAFSFSAPTVVNLLARNGFNEIVLAGIDGGSAYSAAYAQYEHKKLKSIQDSFDVQFTELRRIRDETGVLISSVRCSKAYVLIGAQKEQALAEQVAKWSIRARSFLDVRFVSTTDSSASEFADGRAGTPFSFQRLRLPELADWQGRGLYFDSDMLVFRDVYEVFNADMGENVVLSCQPTPGRAAQYSVFLVDNTRARWDTQMLLDEYARGARSYEQLMGEFSFVSPKSASLPAQWNSLESFRNGETANLHYTDMHRQPWLSTANPLASLWCEALFQALEQSDEVSRALTLSLDAGWVRPSLRWQVERKEPDPWKIPEPVRRLDDRWTPPHLALQRAQMPSRLHLLKWELAHKVRRWGESRNGRRLRYLRDILRKVARVT